MKPVINQPIPKDLNAWLTVFPGLRAAYDLLLEDITTGKEIVPETYYKLAKKVNKTGHHPVIVSDRMTVFIWVETGLLPVVTNAGKYWNVGDKLIDAKNKKTALVIMGTNLDCPGALLYLIEDKLLVWDSPTADHLFKKAE